MLRSDAVAAPAQKGSRIVTGASMPFAVIAVVGLLLPLLLAGPSALTSDESLYLAEAYNIAEGHGFTYPSGEPITHRAPLYPLLLAPAVKVAGSDGAYVVAKLIVGANALLVLVLAWRIGGPGAGWCAGLAAAASSYLSELGTTLYLDPMQCTFLLLALLALQAGVASGGWRLWAAAGLATGAGYLVKESVVQWAPLAMVMALALPDARNQRGAIGAAAFSVAFAVTVSPWWVWVYAQTGELFLIGAPSRALALAPAAVIATAVAAFLLRRVHDGRLSAATASMLAATLVAGWSGFILYGLTRFSTWPYPSEYASSVPRYLIEVAPQAQPYFLIVVAWIWAGWRSVRGDAGPRLLAIAAAMFAPFALFAANRFLQLRDALPIVYLSYVVLGLAFAWAWERLRPHLDTGWAAPAVAAIATVAAFGFFAHEVAAFRDHNGDEQVRRGSAGSWDSPYTDAVARWMTEHIEPGASVLTSRLYFSSLHVATDGRYAIRQLPTVRVDIDADREPMVDARSNLFRWGDGELRRTQRGDTWLHLQRFPGKEYWVGLGQQELLDYIAEHEVEYVVLTGEDVAFSSNAYAWYFTAHPAFELLATLEGDGGDMMFAYAVDPSRLWPIEHSTSIRPRDYAALEEANGLSPGALSSRLGTRLRVTDADGGLSEREKQAATEGIDLAGQ